MLDDQLNRIHTIVGRIATEFSEIEEIWYLIFTCLVADAPKKVTDTIFNLFKTGRQQRQLIMEVATALLDEKHELRNDIISLCEATRTLADRRNDTIHSVIYIMEAALPPRIAAAGISKRSKLADKDIEKEVANLFMEVFDLNVQVNHLRLRAIKFVDPNFDLESDKQRLERGAQQVRLKYESDPILQARSKPH